MHMTPGQEAFTEPAHSLIPPPLFGLDARRA
jgi:hypothetical protein